MPTVNQRNTHHVQNRPPFECTALLLQGGGALGAYQAGVYEALAEAGIHQPFHFCNLLHVRRLASAGAGWQKITRVLHHFHADLDMPDRNAVVNRRLALARRTDTRGHERNKE